MACYDDMDCQCNTCLGLPETKSSSPSAPYPPHPYSNSCPNNSCTCDEYNEDPRCLIRTMSHSEQSKVESGYSGASPQTLCLVTSKLQKLIHQDVDYQSFIDSKTDPTPTSPPIQIFNRLESGQSLTRSGNEVVVDQLQIPRPGVDVDVGETKTRPNSPINNHYNEVEDTNLAMFGKPFHLWKYAVINLVAARNELVFGMSLLTIYYIYPDIYKKLRKLNALNGSYDSSDDPISYVAAQYPQYSYNYFTSHTLGNGRSYDAWS